MRQASSYRAARRNSVSDKRLVPKLSGESWKKPFDSEIKVKEIEEKGKKYPYGSIRQGYDLPLIGG